MRGRRLLEEGDCHAATVPLQRARELEPDKASIREALGRALFGSPALPRGRGGVPGDRRPQADRPLRALLPRARAAEAGQARGGARAADAGLAAAARPRRLPQVLRPGPPPRGLRRCRRPGVRGRAVRPHRPPVRGHARARPAPRGRHRARAGRRADGRQRRRRDGRLRAAGPRGHGGRAVATMRAQRPRARDRGARDPRRRRERRGAAVRRRCLRRGDGGAHRPPLGRPARGAARAAPRRPARRRARLRPRLVRALLADARLPARRPAARAAGIAASAAALGGEGGAAAVRVEPVPIPHDCTDGFLHAFWRRPHAYLDPVVRANISGPRAPARRAGARVRRAPAPRPRQRRLGRPSRAPAIAAELDLGYRLLVAGR